VGARIEVTSVTLYLYAFFADARTVRGHVFTDKAGVKPARTSLLICLRDDMAGRDWSLLAQEAVIGAVACRGDFTEITLWCRCSAGRCRAFSRQKVPGRVPSMSQIPSPTRILGVRRKLGPSFRLCLYWKRIIRNS